MLRVQGGIVIRVSHRARPIAEVLLQGGLVALCLLFAVVAIDDLTHVAIFPNYPSDISSEFFL